ncbi:hypothetical protein TIFTF001_029395 [Ficus carica]|uniref:Myb-like domain-containing protein n=1 Tax=Ficus carica TaxID=3494 RepID=A0AA88DRJ9_FICCA|nr:hypothetical protein TIFTF001_029395 [Ficus carica]
MADTQQGGANTTTSSSSSVMREYRKGNWTVSETMILIEAKKMDDERRMKRSTGGTDSEGSMIRINKPAELRWKWVEDYCWRKNCMRSQNQCNDKWDNLMRDYKKVRDYERKLPSTTTSSTEHCQDQSYWKLEKNDRKEKNLPTNMLPQIYDALVEVVERKTSTTPASVSAGIVGISSPPLSSTTAPTTTLVPFGVVERTTAASAVAATGDRGGSTSIIHHQQDPLMASQALLQHHISPLPIAALPLPPPPAAPSSIQPQPLSYSQPILPTVDSDTRENPSSSHSPAKRRRKEDQQQGQGQAQAQAAGTTSASGRSTSTSSSSREVVASAISKSASIIAEALQASEEREERRHRDLLSLHERRLKIEESKNEINRQGINGLVDAINNLANSIQALASDKHAQSTSKPS